jgi:hypothetical protein
MTETATAEPSDLDREALERAIAIERARDKASRQQIDEKLKTEPWLKVAVFCAQHCQEISLHLKPWECWPPCVVSVDDVDEPGLEHRGITKSAALLRRMLAAGRSRYEPDPLLASCPATDR